jgi:hypothetical protein
MPDPAPDRIPPPRNDLATVTGGIPAHLRKAAGRLAARDQRDRDDLEIAFTA